MNDSLPLLFALLRHVRDLLADPVYQFSTEVSPTCLSEMREGVVRSTGGTDLNCVARHVLEHGFRKVLIISDGHVGRLEPLLQKELERKVQTIAVMADGYDKQTQLIELAGGEKMQGKRWFVLPKAQRAG